MDKLLSQLADNVYLKFPVT